ncbi:MAG: DUF924 family protein [Thermoplasmatota archaeon]
MTSPDDVLSFWFGDGEAWANAKMWFEAGRDLDPMVRQRFLPTIEAAVAGDLEHWAATPEGRLALVVVCDQFTRHAYRDDPRFVAGDAIAQRHAVAAFDAAEDQGLTTAQMMFLLTPLEHAEDRGLQERGIAEAERLGRLHPDDLGDMITYMREHHDIVARFGRLPDRNHLLGRASTPEEETFLASTSLPWFERQPGRGPTGP